MAPKINTNRSDLSRINDRGKPTLVHIHCASKDTVCSAETTNSSSTEIVQFKLSLNCEFNCREGLKGNIPFCSFPSSDHHLNKCAINRQLRSLDVNKLVPIKKDAQTLCVLEAFFVVCALIRRWKFRENCGIFAFSDCNTCRKFEVFLKLSAVN